jgi:hypothetical protein
MKRHHFWGSSFLAAAAFGALLGLLFPFGALGLETSAERNQVWLLTLWTSGVMAICFGASGLLIAITPIGFKDVVEAGSVVGAIEARRAERQTDSPFYNFAGWTVATGLFLILIYFVVWIVTGR